MGQYIKQLFGNIGDAIQLALDRDFSGAKAALSRPIVTEASQEIDKLKAERDTNRANYIQQLKRDKEIIKETIGDIDLKWKKKSEEESEEESETSKNINPFATNEGESLNGGIPSQKDMGINKITGSAKQIRNITINIDALNKGNINTENTTLQRMDAQELEEWFSKMLMRVVRNTELSY
jgi:hypothetical protein